MIGGILLGVAYLIIGYVFITSPLAGILALAVYLAVLFALGGIARGGGLHAPRAAGQLAAVRYRRARFDHRLDADRLRPGGIGHAGDGHRRHRDAVQLLCAVPCGESV